MIYNTCYLKLGQSRCWPSWIIHEFAPQQRIVTAMSLYDATKIGAARRRLPGRNSALESRAAKLYRYETTSAQASATSELGPVSALPAVECSQPSRTSLAADSGLRAIGPLGRTTQRYHSPKKVREYRDAGLVGVQPVFGCVPCLA